MRALLYYNEFGFSSESDAPKTPRQETKIYSKNRNMSCLWCVFDASQLSTLFFNFILTQLSRLLYCDAYYWELQRCLHLEDKLWSLCLTAKEPPELCTFPSKTFFILNCIFTWIQVKTEIPLSCIQSPLPPPCSYSTWILTQYVFELWNCHYDLQNMLFSVYGWRK